MPPRAEMVLYGEMGHQALWDQRKPLLLDGATGTELERRGYRTELPLWTALAAWQVPELLTAVHGDYVQAGAELLTSCTFRTSRYSLAKAGLQEHAEPLTLRAVELAKSCAQRAPRRVWVAGSMGPLEDCYRPELTPEPTVLSEAHTQHARSLAAAGVDLLLVESMPTVCEALAACRAALCTGLPVMLSLLVGPRATLYDGTALTQALAVVGELPLSLLGINCGAASWCTQGAAVLAQRGLGFGVYANGGEPDGSFGGELRAMDARSYARWAGSWLRLGASLVGGCCGTGPEHIAQLRALIDDSPCKSEPQP